MRSFIGSLVLLSSRGIWILAGECQDGLEGIKRARPDVAEDNAQRGESSYRKDGLDRWAAAFSWNSCHAKHPPIARQPDAV